MTCSSAQVFERWRLAVLLAVVGQRAGVIRFLMSGVLRRTWITTERAPVRLDDDLLAMDATRRNRMDDKTFDSLLKLTAASTGRRRLVSVAC